jgi:WD40 repeat protein
MIIALLILPGIASAQNISAKTSTDHPAIAFPAADFVLKDASHKEPKSGVQLQGGQLTIASGVGTPTTINSLSFSADGKILAAGKDFGRVVIWDVAEKKFLKAIETNQGQVNAVSVSPDGKSIATGGSQDNNSVKVWDISSGKLVWTFQESKAAIRNLFFDMQGKWLIAVNNDSTLYVLDANERKPVMTLPGIHAAAMSRDGQALVTTDGKEFAVWIGPAWSKTQSLPMWKNSSLLLAANTAKDQLAVYESRSVRIAQLSTAQIVLDRADLVPKNFTWIPTFAAFSADGAILYLSLSDHLLILNIKIADTCGSPLMYSGAAALSPDGQWFAGAKDDSILSKERTDGVWVWNTSRLLKKCGLADSLKTQVQ